MKNLKLIFFTGCPNYLPAKELLLDLGLEFEEVCQDGLQENDFFRKYSSPSLLLEDKIIFGSLSEGGSCSVAIPTKETLMKRLQSEEVN